MSNLDIAALQRQLEKNEAESAQLRQQLQEAQLVNANVNANANAVNHGRFNGNKLANRSQSSVGHAMCSSTPMMVISLLVRGG